MGRSSRVITYARPVNRWVRLTLAVSTVFAFVLGSATTAAAHGELTSTTPTDNAALTAAPQSLELQFTDAQSPTGATIVATTSGGEAVELPAAATAGSTVSVPWPAANPAGGYIVNWRSLGTDGHVLSGSFTFSYTAGGAAANTPSASAGPLQSPARSVDEAAADTAWVWLLLAIGIGVLIIAAAITMIRRRSQGLGR